MPQLNVNQVTRTERAAHSEAEKLAQEVEVRGLDVDEGDEEEEEEHASSRPSGDDDPDQQRTESAPEEDDEEASDLKVSVATLNSGALSNKKDQANQGTPIAKGFFAAIASTIPVVGSYFGSQPQRAEDEEGTSNENHQEGDGRLVRQDHEEMPNQALKTSLQRPRNIYEDIGIRNQGRKDRSHIDDTIDPSGQEGNEGLGLVAPTASPAPKRSVRGRPRKETTQVQSLVSDTLDDANSKAEKMPANATVNNIRSAKRSTRSNESGNIVVPHDHAAKPPDKLSRPNTRHRNISKPKPVLSKRSASTAPVTRSKGQPGIKESALPPDDGHQTEENEHDEEDGQRSEDDLSSPNNIHPSMSAPEAMERGNSLLLKESGSKQAVSKDITHSSVIERRREVSEIDGHLSKYITGMKNLMAEAGYKTKTKTKVNGDPQQKLAKDMYKCLEQLEKHYDARPDLQEPINRKKLNILTTKIDADMEILFATSRRIIPRCLNGESERKSIDTEMLKDLYLYVLPKFVCVIDSAYNAYKDEEPLKSVFIEEIVGYLKGLLDLTTSARRAPTGDQPIVSGYIVIRPTVEVRPMIRNLLLLCKSELEERRQSERMEAYRSSQPERAKRLRDIREADEIAERVKRQRENARREAEKQRSLEMARARLGRKPGVLTQQPVRSSSETKALYHAGSQQSSSQSSHFTTSQRYALHRGGAKRSLRETQAEREGRWLVASAPPQVRHRSFDDDDGYWDVDDDNDEDGNDEDGNDEDGNDENIDDGESTPQDDEMQDDSDEDVPERLEDMFGSRNLNPKAIAQQQPWTEQQIFILAEGLKADLSPDRYYNVQQRLQYHDLDEVIKKAQEFKASMEIGFAQVCEEARNGGRPEPFMEEWVSSIGHEEIFE